MPWPDVTDFTGAIQRPSSCFDDSALRSGKVKENRKGLPLMWSGGFATVYQISGSSGDHAVRCFTNQVKDQQQRYARLSNYLRREKPPGFVGFKYLPNGIAVKGERYPIVKMDWVNGLTLDQYVENNLNHPDTLKRIAGKWLETATELQQRDIAHNDLQHGNVMVLQDGSIHLVDYDGIFLPYFRGSPSPELGHLHYQHPRRTANDYDGWVDNFPALVIYLSLLALSSKPGLWQRFYNQKNLLFTKSDYENPANSQCFQALKSIPDKTVQELAAYLEDCCTRPVAQVKTLASILQTVPPIQIVPPIPPSSTYLQLLQGRQSDEAKLQAAETRLQAAQAELQAFRNQAAVEKVNADRELNEERVLRRDAESDKAAAEAKLQTTQAEMQALRNQAAVEKANADRELNEERVLRRDAESDKAESNRILQDVQAELEDAKAELRRCPECNRFNWGKLIYCDNEECAAELKPEYQTCAFCDQETPVNARYCPDCGRRLA